MTLATVAMIISEGAMLALTVLVLIGLRPFWSSRSERDVRHLTMGVSWFVGSGAVTGMYGTYVATTSATLPVLISPWLPIPVSVILASGAAVGAAHILLFLVEIIPPDERRHYNILTAAFYPHRFRCILRKLWRPRQS